jgi:hypothetical protein
MGISVCIREKQKRITLRSNHLTSQKEEKNQMLCGFMWDQGCRLPWWELEDHLVPVCLTLVLTALDWSPSPCSEAEIIENEQLLLLGLLLCP